MEDWDVLSQRQREILEQMLQGLSNSEIAFRIGVGSETVKTHVAQILQRLRARDRIDLLRRALEQRGYFLEAVLQDVPCPVVLIGDDRRVLFVNGRFEHAAGVIR